MSGTNSNKNIKRRRLSEAQSDSDDADELLVKKFSEVKVAVASFEAALEKRMGKCNLYECFFWRAIGMKTTLARFAALVGC